MLDKDILRINSISEYNDILEIETLHPLVSVIDLSKVKPLRHKRYIFGFYAVFLKDAKCGDILYGRQYYDYQKGSIVCLAPGQIIGIEDNGQDFQPSGWALLFHPDLIAGTPLNKMMKEYTYFSYDANEALHISERERTLFLTGLERIHEEMEYNIDRFSKRLISSQINLLLDYCLRFYERQFITRHKVNNDIIIRFEAFLSDYFNGGQAKEHGIPTVKDCASKLCLSPNYFGDLIKKETGHSPQETIHNKVIDIAKGMIADKELSISEISYELGFHYPQGLSRMFKNITGYTPSEYLANLN